MRKKLQEPETMENTHNHLEASRAVIFPIMEYFPVINAALQVSDLGAR